jgi:NADH-quinone oxidoreductase subunit J
LISGIELLFLLFGGAEAVSALLIFKFRDMLHVGVALSTIFFLNAIIFLIAQQPLLAVIQLFVMVGGISTYFIIGVASLGVSRFRHVRVLPIVAFAVVIFALMAYPLLGRVVLSGAQAGQITDSAISAQLVAYIGILYLVAFLLFMTSIGSILIFRFVSDNR